MIRSLHGSDNKWFEALIMADVVSQMYAPDLPHVVTCLLFVRETVAAMIKTGDQMSVSCVAVSHRAGV